jgi:NAD(P)-dependent dehydrogenase (short-subunit alcohol dehydrogenase family)
MNDHHLAVLGDLSGKTAVITGANNGIGWQTASALAGAGATVVLAGRNRPALDAAEERIRLITPTASLDSAVLDLADQFAIHTFATELADRYSTIDLLINNAGVMAIPERQLTKDGFELTFGTNHLGHFALTGLLLPQLLSAPAARVVTVSAVISRRGAIDFDNLELEVGYKPFGAYSASKLANVAFAVELADRAAAAGLPLKSIAVHPGTSSTGIQRHGGRLSRAFATALLEPLLGQRPEEAARPSLLAATDPDIVSGGFYGPSGRGELRGTPGRVLLPAPAEDADFRRRLWTVSEQLTGVQIEFGALENNR